jgi:hypothetical protein
MYNVQWIMENVRLKMGPLSIIGIFTHFTAKNADYTEGSVPFLVKSEK